MTIFIWMFGYIETECLKKSRIFTQVFYRLAALMSIFSVGWQNKGFNSTHILQEAQIWQIWFTLSLEYGKFFKKIKETYCQMRHDMYKLTDTIWVKMPWHQCTLKFGLGRITDHNPLRVKRFYTISRIFEPFQMCQRTLMMYPSWMTKPLSCETS